MATITLLQIDDYLHLFPTDRGNVSLGDILQFVLGSTKLPAAGFNLRSASQMSCAFPERQRVTLASHSQGRLDL